MFPVPPAAVLLRTLRHHTIRPFPPALSSPLHHPLDPVQPHLQHLHLWTVAKAHEVVAGRVEEVAALGRVQVEEDSGDDL